MNTINGTTVPDEMYAVALSQSGQGRRLYLAFAEEETSRGCSNCNGGGMVMLEWVTAGPFEQPPHGNAMNVDGLWFKAERKSYPCPLCRVEDARLLRAALIADSGLYDNELGFRLSYIKDMPGKEIALNEANTILSQVPPIGFSIFFGDYGVGKSGILKSIVASMILMGVKAKYTRAMDMLTHVRSTYSDNSDTEARAMDMFSSYQLIAIDEVDRISETDWARTTLFSILDDRYSIRNARATILASNQFPDQLGDAWAYLMDRLKDGRRVPVGGESLRGRVSGEQDSLILSD